MDQHPHSACPIYFCLASLRLRTKSCRSLRKESFRKGYARNSYAIPTDSYADPMEFYGTPIDCYLLAGAAAGW